MVRGLLLIGFFLNFSMLSLTQLEPDSLTSSATSEALTDTLNLEELTEEQLYRMKIDSLLARDANRLLSPEFYKERYNEKDLLHKVTDNFGDGFDSLYGTRNLRPILHGVAYRGGANNYYHKTRKRHNHNPLPNDGVRNLCQEGFSASIYLYRQNFESAPPVDTCACISGGWNDMKYYQFDYNDDAHIYEALKVVNQSAVNDSIGPVYLHCWNGWHASGLLSALSLMQFCGFDKWEAINYWDLGTDGANNSPRYQVIREIIKNFEPYPDLLITDELGNRICPPMPEHIDSSELYVDVEHLVYVPESLPVGFSIVMHNVSFAAGRTSFSNPENNTDIKNLLLALEQQPALKVELGGYTDNTGSVSQNIELSKQRAKFIHDILIEKGVDPERISYKGYGPKKPLYSNRYKSTREGNRRIEILILEKNKEDYSTLIEDEATGSNEEESTVTLDSFLANAKKLELGTSVVIPSLVYEPNAVEVPESAKEELSKIIIWLKENPSQQLEIAGHTDRSGLEELNQLLSEQRAEAVYNHLIENGVSNTQITFSGYGSQHPIASNKYQYGKEKNRRIELKLLDSID